MFDPKGFVELKAKPLPVFLLLDVSGSMSWKRKIDNLNEAVKKMIGAMSNEEKMEVEIQISVITFSSSAQLHLSATSASQVEWTDMNADGSTSMGAAIKMAKDMIEDKEITPSRAYIPTIVLVSDGHPTDSWEQPLEDFVKNGRSKKCDRMAMAIGSDADENVLKRFIEGTEHKLFYADGAGDLHEFFRYVTMSVTTRSRSQKPNEIPADSDIKSKVADKSNQTNENSAESAQSNGGTDDDEW